MAYDTTKALSKVSVCLPASVKPTVLDSACATHMPHAGIKWAQIWQEAKFSMTVCTHIFVPLVHTPPDSVWKLLVVCTPKKCTGQRVLTGTNMYKRLLSMCKVLFCIWKGDVCARGKQR